MESQSRTTGSDAALAYFLHNKTTLDAFHRTLNMMRWMNKQRFDSSLWIIFDFQFSWRLCFELSLSFESSNQTIWKFSVIVQLILIFFPNQETHIRVFFQFRFLHKVWWNGEMTSYSEKGHSSSFLICFSFHSFGCVKTIWARFISVSIIHFLPQIHQMRKKCALDVKGQEPSSSLPSNRNKLKI